MAEVKSESVSVDPASCIGSGVCAGLSPIFVTTSGATEVRPHAFIDSSTLDDAIGLCPVEAIAKRRDAELTQDWGAPGTEYSSLDPLRTRMEIHRRFSQQPDDIDARVIRALVLGESGTLVDVGCGTGSFLARIQSVHPALDLTGVDTSAAAVDTVSALGGITGLIADARDLPIESASVDRVTARHMLYHVSHPERAVAEMARILGRSGRCIVTVNHAATAPWIGEAMSTAASEAGVDLAHTFAPVHSDNVDELIATAFPVVRSVRVDNAFVFPEPAPVIAFGEAAASVYGVPAAGEQRDAILGAFRARVNDWFAHHDRLIDPKGYSVVVGSFA
ncbi:MULTISPECIES: class I SAM-dependent methyltransferase [Arthrobacter]|uniref:Class I SAM-dependent methyltransferase n=1 Tax=Arthrobacter terricola TaxID=2547396 RepID=A0A4R5KAA8_9MICC|nr:MULTISPECIES: class I SAM-dependent methyltransferase [Arthrobacter]MBT8163012.1 class I SAM-dependent methyltransferase [Arthrobacter sp. GN70]TDF91782.1 class I SAM-dependent methyltransferase [Arthrobacter terricola]